MLLRIYKQTNIMQNFNNVLSPFGQQVLQTMKKHWSQNFTKVRHMQGYGRKTQKVMTFNGRNDLPAAPLSIADETLSRSGFQTINQNVETWPVEDIEDAPIIPFTEELVTSVVGENLLTAQRSLDCNNYVYSSDNITTNINNDACLNNISNLDSYYDRNTHNIKDVETEDLCLKRKNSSSVNWDDMFDSELFTEANTRHGNDRINIIPPPSNFNTNANILKVQNQINEKLQKTTTKVEKIKPRKRTHQETITKMAGVKVVKQLADTGSLKGNNLRKEKYKTVVQNWLENVIDNNLENDPNNSKNPTSNKQIRHSNKNTIQTCLANKGGIMKFEKPKTSTVSITELETKLGKEREKKRQKFVAPIKSQVIVKDIVYDITILDSSDSCVNTIKELKDEDAQHFTLLLVYRNGFCQLNCQYSSETSVPDGVLLHGSSSTKYYYIKHTSTIKHELKTLLADILENFSMVCYDGKYALKYLKQEFDLQTNRMKLHFLDAKIAASLLDPDADLETFSDLQKLLSYVPEYTVATECCLQKTAWYSTLLEDCMDVLKTNLADEALWDLFIKIEMRLLPIVAGMEQRGVHVDIDTLKTMEAALLKEITAIEQECYRVAGHTFQINSHVQVRSILYDELKLDCKTNVKIKETLGTGAKSTSEPMLRSLVAFHPLPQLILDYRQLHKAHATFLAGILQHTRDGVVKPTCIFVCIVLEYSLYTFTWSYNRPLVQTAAATGRIASSNPNLQAIPKTPFALKLSPEQLMFRDVYKSRPGYCLLAADFKHVECRVFAHVAADSSLVEMLSQHHDIFKALASKWLSKSMEEVTVEDRERSKRIVYASLYGAGVRKLMDILNMSYEQTLSVVSTFNRTFPSLKSFGRSVVSSCHAPAYRVSTVCGRARRLPGMGSADAGARDHAERQAVNFVIQGSAADLCKIAMIMTDERLQDNVEAHLVLQIHDELVWEVAEQDLAVAAEIIKHTMEDVGRRCGMDTTLPVALCSGERWGTMQHLSI